MSGILLLVLIARGVVGMGGNGRLRLAMRPEFLCPLVNPLVKPLCELSTPAAAAAGTSLKELDPDAPLLPYWRAAMLLNSQLAMLFTGTVTLLQYRCCCFLVGVPTASTAVGDRGATPAAPAAGLCIAKSAAAVEASVVAVLFLRGDAVNMEEQGASILNGDLQLAAASSAENVSYARSGLGDMGLNGAAG